MTGNRFVQGTALKETRTGLVFLDFKPNRITALRLTPARAAETGRSSTSHWRGTRDPFLDVAAMFRELDRFEPDKPLEVWRRRHFRAFTADLPKEIAPLISNGFSHDTWPLFQLLVSSAAARDVCATEAGARVCFALAFAHHLLGQPPKNVAAFCRRWACRKQRDILGRLSFPRAQFSVTALAKVPRTHLSLSGLKDLRMALLMPASRKLCLHMPRLSRALLAHLQPRILPFCGHALLVELAALDPPPWRARRTEEVLAWCEELGMLPPVFSSVAEIRDLHEQLVEKVRARREAQVIELPAFPDVLTPEEKERVRPLTDSRAYRNEGEQMHHCLGTFPTHLETAQQGDLYALAIDAPERLTLALGRGGDRRWCVVEMAGPHNAPASEEACGWARDLAARLDRLAT
jgi:hypothetical protein